MKASIGDILAIVPVAEKVSIADVCDCEEVYTGIAKDVPIGLKNGRWNASADMTGLVSVFMAPIYV